MIRMILADLDHTLLREDGSISDETLSILRRCRERGVLFTLATSRYRIGAERYARLLEPDYEITADGTQIYAGQECIFRSELSEQDTSFIIRSILAAAPDTEITMAAGETVYWNSRHIAASEKLHKAVYCDFTPPPATRVSKIAARLPDADAARRIANAAGCRLQAYRGESWYAFLPAGAGKTAAGRALAACSGIPPEDMAAFGDDDADIGMLRLCGTGVAVANAAPAVLEAADDVTLSNDRDGVALWLNCHCLYRSLLASAFNTRELGGHPAADGRTTLPGRIWRSGAPTVWNEPDARLLRSTGMTTLIDLRTVAETEARPCAYAGAPGFEYRSIPLSIGAVPPDSLEAVPDTYLAIAEQEETAAILRTIADARTGVLIFCTAGKDRTGVIAALLLLACGVDRETIVSDYAVSREYNRLRLERFLADHPGIDRRIVLASESSMERFLDLFAERFGSVEAYFDRPCLTPAHLARIRRALLG